MKRLFLSLAAVLLAASSVYADDVRVIDPVTGSVRMVPLDEYVESLIGKDRPRPLDYADGYAKAKAERLPLVVFRSQEVRPVAGCVVCLKGSYVTEVWVGVQDRNGDFWRQTLTGKPTDDEIRHAIHDLDKAVNAPPVQRAAVPNQGACSCGVGRCFCYPASKCSRGGCPKPPGVPVGAATFTLPAFASVVCKT